MNIEDPYVQIAPFYDLEFESVTEDIELYLGYAGMVGGPILELGSGTGRLLTRLATAGYPVHGVDVSPDMNRIALKRLTSEGLEQRVTIHERKMSDLQFLSGQTFRLVISAINSFLHLESRDEHLRALESIRGVLDRDGLLIVDIFNPSPETLMRMDERYAFDARWSLPDGGEVQRSSYRTVESANQIISTTLFYDVVDRTGSIRRHTTSYQMRYIHRFEMESLLSESGFELEGVYGSYQLDPVDQDSSQLIFVAHRTPFTDET